MIITRTPYRISFVGGGSDYKSYYEKFGGAVLSSTIAKYCHIMVRKTPPFLGAKYHVSWAKTERVDRIEDIEHPSVRGCLQYLAISDGVEVKHGGEMPAGSGVGSSSAFTVGMLHGLHALMGERPSRTVLAAEAIEVEQVVLKETVGIQDQIACAWGGTSVISFNHDGRYKVEPLHWEPEAEREIESHLMLLFTGVQRHASEIAASQVDNVDRKQKEIAALVGMVPVAADAMEKGMASKLGYLLHDSWKLKRELSDLVTTPEIDEIYDNARKAGAYGGKIIGAGGGGFLLICAPPEKHKAIAEATEPISLPVKFEHRGSEIVLAEP